jgi:hypothetical protein
MFTLFLGCKKKGLRNVSNCYLDAYWDDVVLMMHMDGADNSTTFIDETGKTVSVTGDTKIKTSQSKFGGSSAYFDGTGDYLSVSDASLSLGTGDFTVECWAYFNNKTGYQSLLSKGYIATGDLLVQTSQNTSSFRFYASGTLIATESSEASLNAWHHYAFVRKSGVLTIYRDGTVTGSGACTQDLTNSISLKIGVGTHLVDGSYYFSGYIDEVRVTKGIARYDNNPTKLLMHFDNDMIGVLEETEKTLTKYGSPSITTAKKMVGTSSCYFSGSSYYTVPSSADWSFGTGDFTIEFWMYPTSNGAQGIASNLHSNTAQWNVMFYDGYVTLSDWFNFYLDRTGTKVSLNTWTHVAISRENTTLRLFLNGNNTKQVSNSYNFSVDGLLEIGYCSANGIYSDNLYLDELRISKGIARYTANFTPSTTPFTPDAYTKLLCHFEGAPGVAVEETGKMVSVYGNTTVSNTQSKFGGYSGYFDGSDSYLAITVNSDLLFEAGDFTIEFWIYQIARSPGAITWLLDTRPVGANGFYPAIRINSTNNISFYVNSAEKLTGTTAITLNTWYHVALCKWGSNVSFYVNGIHEASSVDSNTYSAYTRLMLGNSSSNNGGTAVALTGYIDELRISKGKALYSYNSEDTLLLHFNPTATTGTNEETGKTLTPSGAPAISTDIKKFGSSSVDLRSGQIRFVDSSLDLTDQDFTVEFWVYYVSYGTNNIMSYGQNAQGYAAMAFYNFNAYFSDGATWKLTLPYPAFPGNTWLHLAIVRNGNTITIYSNGVQYSTGTFTGSLVYGSYGLIIGDYAGNPFTGYIDEFRVSNVARYTSNFTPATEPFTVDANTKLLAHFEGTFGPQTIVDETGKSVTRPWGVADISTEQFKFGGYSGKFLLTDAIRVANTNSCFLFASDFTIECFVYYTSLHDNTHLFNIGTSKTMFRWYQGAWQFFIANPNLMINPFNYTTTPNLNQWYHYAIVRLGGTFTFYIDGISVASISLPVHQFGDEDLTINGYGGGSGYGINGYIDEFRIVNGNAKYTNNFTVPSQAFTYNSGTVVNYSNNALPPTDPFTYEGAITSVSGSIPPTEKFPSCRTPIEEPVASSGKGYFGGGNPYHGTIDGIDFTSEAASTPSAVLSIGRRGPAGVNSSTKGYWAGGYSDINAAPSMSRIDGFVFSTEALTALSSVLSVARYYLAGTSSSSKGYFGGGGNYSNEIDGIDFTNDAATNPSATLSTARHMLAGVSSSTKGYWGGGNPTTNVIDGLWFSSEAGFTSSATLISARANLAGVSSSTKGYFGGGYFGSPINEIDGINFTTEAAVNPSATLSVARGQLGGVSGTAKGYFGGGFTSSASNEIEGIDFVTEVAVNPSATLSVARDYITGVSYIPATGGSGGSSGTGGKGYFGGGFTSSSSNEIDGIDFVTEVAINPSATLSINTQGLAGVNSSSKGYFGGGYTSTSTNKIESFTFSSEIVGSLSATLSAARFYLAGVSGSTKGYFGGGVISGYSNEIDGIDFVTEAAVNPSATLSVARSGQAGVASSTKGYFGGGYTGSYSSVIDGINFTTEAAFATGATLSVSRYNSAGVSSSTKGYFGGGSNGNYLAEIDGIDFTTEAAINPSATLSVARRALAGISYKV